MDSEQGWNPISQLPMTDDVVEVALLFHDGYRFERMRGDLLEFNEHITHWRPNRGTKKESRSNGLERIMNTKTSEIHSPEGGLV